MKRGSVSKTAHYILLRVAAGNGHDIGCDGDDGDEMVIAPVMMMMVMMVPANYEKTAVMVMMVVMMILRHLDAISAFRHTLRAGGVIGIEKRYSIRNRRQKIGI